MVYQPVSQQQQRWNKSRQTTQLYTGPESLLPSCWFYARKRKFSILNSRLPPPAQPLSHNSNKPTVNCLLQDRRSFAFASYIRDFIMANSRQDLVTETIFRILCKRLCPPESAAGSMSRLVFRTVVAARINTYEIGGTVETLSLKDPDKRNCQIRLAHENMAFSYFV